MRARNMCFDGDTPMDTKVYKLRWASFHFDLDIIELS